MHDSDAFDDLMDHWEEQFAQGNELSPEELCRDYPAFLDSARKYIRAMKAVGGGAAHAATISKERPEPATKSKYLDIPGYEILDELGRGGMGVVYRARQTSLKRLVALKMVLREDLAGQDDIARFRGEAEALGQLQHPNIVQVYDVGESGGHPYFALELVAGGSLNKRLAGAMLPPREAAELIQTLARAVHFAHERGFIHRDLKPGNILLDSSGEPKITDFGLAKRWSAMGTVQDSPVQTASGEVLGTPAYMAPEQARGEVRGIGPGADIYSLGAIFYELLTGQLPFRGQSVLDVLDQVINSAPMRPRRMQRGIPRDLDTICLKCLEKIPARRYLSANLLAEDLQRFLDGKPILARPITMPIRFGRWCRRNPLLASTSIAAFLFLLVAAVISALFAIESERGRKDLQTNRDKLSTALDVSETHRKASLRSLAESSLDRGLAQCEQGEIIQGMWWLARALTAAEEFEDLTFVIEANLSAWSGQMCALEQVLEHPQPVTAAAISADSSLLAATIAGEPRIRVWSLATGKPVPLDFRDGDREIASLAFHPFQPILAAVGADQKLRIWDVRGEPKLLFALTTQGVINKLRFSQDGRWLGGVQSGSTLSFWDASDEFQPGKPVDQALNAFDFAFLPISPVVLAANYAKQKLHFWDCASGRASGQDLPTLEIPLTVAASADGRYFATAGLKQLPTLYLLEGRQRLSNLPGLPDHLVSMAFHPRLPLLLMGKLSGSAGLWNAPESRPHGSPMVHAAGLRSALYTPDGLRVVTSASDRTTRVWRLPADPELQSFIHPEGEKVVDAAISSDGLRIVSVSRDSPQTPERISLWDAQSGQEIGGLHLFATKARFDQSGRWVLLFGKLKQVQLWDVTNSQFSSFKPSHDGALISDADFTPDGRQLISAGHDGTIRIWDLAQEKLVFPSRQVGLPVTRLLLNSRGTRLLAFGDRRDGKEQPTLWDTTNGERVDINVIEPAASIHAAAFSPDGRSLAMTGKDGAIRLWDPANGADLGTLDGHTSVVTDLAFHPDGSLIVSASADGTVRIWRIDGKELVGTLRHPREVASVALSPDGRTFLTRSLVDLSIRLWDVKTLRQLGPARTYSRAGTGHFQSTSFFAPDGKSVLMAGDSTVRQFAVPDSRQRGMEFWSNWLRARTGQELDSAGAFRVLGSKEWQEAAATATEDK